MPVPAVEFTPVRSPRGRDKRVHATTLRTPNETACGTRCGGWIVATRTRMGVPVLDCDDCKDAIFNRTASRRRS